MAFHVMSRHYKSKRYTHTHDMILPLHTVGNVRGTGLKKHILKKHLLMIFLFFKGCISWLQIGMKM